jgi:hypothetical protein
VVALTVKVREKTKKEKNQKRLLHGNSEKNFKYKMKVNIFFENGIKNYGDDVIRSLLFEKFFVYFVTDFRANSY